MKKVLLLAILIFGFVVAAAFAGGDKNCIRHQGDNGQGAVERHQIKVNK